MKMSKNYFLLGVLCTVVFGQLAIAPVQAQEPEALGGAIDISQTDCRTLLKMENEEQDFVLVFFHGFMHGKNNNTILNDLALGKTTDKIIDHCIDNPQDKVLKAFELYAVVPSPK